MINKIYLGKSKKYAVQDGLYKVSSDGKVLEAEVQKDYSIYNFRSLFADFREYVACLIAPELKPAINKAQSDFNKFRDIHRAWAKDTQGRDRAITKLHFQKKELVNYIKSLYKYQEERGDDIFIRLPMIPDKIKNLLK